MTLAGLPQGQEKSGKTKKNDKSQVKCGFLKKVRKIQILSVQIYQISYI